MTRIVAVLLLSLAASPLLAQAGAAGDTTPGQS